MEANTTVIYYYKIVVSILLLKGPNTDELYKKYEDQFKYYQERNELREKNLKVDRSICITK